MERLLQIRRHVLASSTALNAFSHTLTLSVCIWLIRYHSDECSASRVFSFSSAASNWACDCSLCIYCDCERSDVSASAAGAPDGLDYCWVIYHVTVDWNPETSNGHARAPREPPHRSPLNFLRCRHWTSIHCSTATWALEP